MPLLGNNFDYKSGDIHTLTQTPDKFGINLQYILLNDTVDVLDLKDKEFDAKTSNAIGDMSGEKIGLTYGFNDTLMMGYNISRQNLEYNNNKINNTKNEFFVRKNFLQNDKKNFSGISLDLGAISNQLGNYYISNIDDINEVSKRYYVDKSYKLEKSNGDLYAVSGNSSTALSYQPWVGIEDTNDMNFYFRAITGLNTKNDMIDVFLGVKKTKISNKLVANKELVDVAKSHGIGIEKDLSRSEINYFAGLSGRHEWNLVGIEYLYQYDRFQRDSGLDYVNFNHTVDITFDWKVQENLLFYMGGRAMYRQLNGEIPYLYNQYSQTTYDHEYGYSKFGLIYNF
jgi:hypothetical protein